jgi:ABC-type cobalamin/Fe3+-siderophores transport system ATPase subunit
VAVTGPSGSGKSTLLNVIGAMDRCDSGSIRVGDFDVNCSLGLLFTSRTSNLGSEPPAERAPRAPLFPVNVSSTASPHVLAHRAPVAPRNAEDWRDRRSSRRSRRSRWRAIREPSEKTRSEL